MCSCGQYIRQQVLSRIKIWLIWQKKRGSESLLDTTGPSVHAGLCPMMKEPTVGILNSELDWEGIEEVWKHLEDQPGEDMAPT